MRAGIYQALRRMVRHSVLWFKIAVLVFAGIAPAFMTDIATAAQLSPRKVTISSSKSNQSGVQYDFAFSWPTSTAVQSMIFQFCTTPLGACTKPNAMDVNFNTTTLDGSTGFPNGTAFTEYTTTGTTGDCVIAGTNADTRYCVTRSEAATGTGTNATVDLGSILNPTISSGVYMTVYVRVSLYSDTAFATKVHEGVVAAGIVQQLTAVGRVAERLKFCVGAMEDIEAGSGETLPSDCDDNVNFPSTTLVDLGIIDNVSIVASPVEPSLANANTANDSYGILQVNTNASSGIAITYYPEEATSVTGGDTDQLRAFRVVPTDCSATTTSTTDQCFVSETVTGVGSGITQGFEEFGMAVACINANDGTRSTTDNFDPANGGVVEEYYEGDGDFDESTQGGISDNCENEPTPSGDTYKWGFDISGTPVSLANTTSATEKVVDDEIIKIRFGATASATTPTGTYTVIITYIATPTF